MFKFIPSLASENPELITLTHPDAYEVREIYTAPRAFDGWDVESGLFIGEVKLNADCCPRILRSPGQMSLVLPALFASTGAINFKNIVIRKLKQEVENLPTLQQYTVKDSSHRLTHLT